MPRRSLSHAQVQCDHSRPDLIWNQRTRDELNEAMVAEIRDLRRAQAASPPPNTRASALLRDRAQPLALIHGFSLSQRIRHPCDRHTPCVTPLALLGARRPSVALCRSWLADLGGSAGTTWSFLRAIHLSAAS